MSSGGYSLYTAALVATAAEDVLLEYLYPLMDGLREYFAVLPFLENGCFVLPEVPGIPIRVDWDKLERRRQIVSRASWTSAEVARYEPAVIS